MTPQETAALPVIGADTRMRLHDLASRPDGADEVIVGRLATGDFVRLPTVGMRVLELLSRHHSVAETRARVAEESGEEVDVADFVSELITLGFVAEVDGLPVPAPEPRRPTFPRLTPRHAAWSLSPVLPVAVGVLALSAAAALAARPQMVPNYHDLVWSRYGSLVLLVMFGVGWPLLLLHEAAHLITARAAGVPARVELGTRLQFLVVQTDMGGIELAPRRHRLTAYLAGIAVNVTIASCAILAMAWTRAGSPAHQALAILTILALIPLPFQAMVFMRTDVYFVLQDLTGCPDLFGDGRAYACYLARRLLPGRRHPSPADPSANMPATQRRAVRVYSVVLVVGTVLCLAALAAVTAPTDISVLATAARHLGPGNSAVQRLDGLVVLLLLGGVQVLWIRTRWRTYRRHKRNRSEPQ